MKRKNVGPILKFTRMDLPENMMVWYLDSLEDLYSMRNKDDLLVETDQDFLLVKKYGLVRYAKPGSRPQIIKAQNITVNPDHYDCQVVLSEEELFSFAKSMRLPVLELEDEYVIPSSVFLRAPKEIGECSS